NNTNAQMQELQEFCLEQNIKKINRIYVLGNFFTSKQLEQINQELNAMGNDMPLNDKSTLHDLHIILLRLGITTNQLPLSGKPVIKSKYNELDLRYFGTWVFVDFDKNNLYQQYENLVKHLHDAPDTYEFSLLRALAAEYTSKIEKLALAKQQALDIKNSILEFYSK
nr:hypothetical protein [Alphaproteobacteria bacterium]